MRIAHVSTASIALLLVLCGPAARGGVGIESVTPGQGVPDRETTLTVDGSSFAPGSRVSLLDGGPLLAATIPIADSQAMALRGTLLYVAAGTSLSVVDVASPATPVTLGTVDLGLYPTFLVADGDRLYLGRGYDGVVVFDLADPLHPLRRGSAPVNGYLLAGAISGPWLHVAANDSGFATLDVSDPDHPFVAGTLALPTGYAEAVARLDATHVLVAFAGYGLVVLDVSAPGRPAVEAAVPGTGIADVIVLDPGVAASAQERAVAIDQSLHRLVFYDLRNPAAPVVTRTIPLTDYWSLSGVAVAGSRLVVSAPGGGAVVVDARDGGPAVVSNLQTFGSASRIAGRGGYAFLADGRPGVRVVDLRSPARPPHEAQLDVHGDAWDVYLTGPLVHVAAAVNLAIVDVTNPFAPTIVGETPAQPLTHSIVSTGAYDFTLRNGMSALFAFDVGNPGAPQLTNWVYSGYLPQGMDTDGSYLYLPDLYRFRIYTATPSLYPLGTSPTVGQGRATACAFGTCYFAGDLDPRGTIEIIDVSNPFRPVHRGGLYMPGPALGTAIADNLVLVVGGYSTWGGDRGYLRICDLSRPSAPRVVGALDFVGMGTDVQYWGSAFVTNSEGVLEIDISNPAQPVLVGRHPLPGFNRRLAITNGSAIVASGAAGLQIVGPRPAVPVPAFVSTSRLVASVPQGLPEGPYDVLVTAPDGSTARLTNAYRVCPARGLTLALDPVLKGTGPEIRPPVPWRARLDGDTTLLGRNDGQDVFLELPALPPVVEEQQLVTGGPDTIELTLLPDRATVLLSGRDPSALATRWSSLRAAGRVSLPSRGGNEYGDLTIASAGLVRPASARRYVYTFDGAALSAVRYGGVDADLLFGASIRNGYGCVYDTSVDFAQRLVELCGGSLGDGGGVLCPGR